MAMRQFYPHTKSRLILFCDEWQTSLLLIRTSLNCTPYHSSSLISPESIINPRSQIADYTLQVENGSTTKEQMRALPNALQEVRL